MPCRQSGGCRLWSSRASPLALQLPQRLAPRRGWTVKDSILATAASNLEKAGITRHRTTLPTTESAAERQQAGGSHAATVTSLPLFPAAPNRSAWHARYFSGTCTTRTEPPSTRPCEVLLLSGPERFACKVKDGTPYNRKMLTKLPLQDCECMIMNS